MLLYRLDRRRCYLLHGSLATRLRVLRAERGLTVRDAAGLSGVAKETISQIERGERHPYDRTLAKLARAYEVPVEELLSVEEEKQEESAPLGEAAKRPAKLDDIKSDYREAADALNQFSALWERRLERGELDRERVRAFLEAATGYLPSADVAMIDELLALTPIIGTTQDDGISDAMKVESVMYPAVTRLNKIGRKIQALADATEAANVVNFEARRDEALLSRLAG
jgi:transcriptional regulator with XRE-family HTH domain